MQTNRLDAQQVQAMVERSSFNRWLGMQVVSLDEQSLTLKISWREELVSSPERQSTHGGVIAALVDCCADYAIAAAVGYALPTLDLHIDYHKVAKPGDLYAKATITYLGGKLGVAQAKVLDEQGHLVASGRGMYMLRVPTSPAPQSTMF